MLSSPQVFKTALALCLALLAALGPALHAQDLSAAVRPQIEALQAEKARRSPAQQKIDSQLIYSLRKQRGERLGAGLLEMERAVKVPGDGLELIDIKARVTPALLAAIEASGGRIVAAVPRFDGIRAQVPLTAIETLAARADVRSVRRAVRAHTNVGTVTAEGDLTHRADAVRGLLNATGRGIRIGVLSDSVDSLTASQASNDLGPVTVLPGQSGLGGGNSGEGTAMLEIIHDLAPDAELFFATAFLSEEQFAQNILDLRAAGCDIIVDDVGYFDESPFQDGPVAQAVNEVVANGALYFSSAGNDGNKNDGTSGAWEGDFVDAGPTGSPIAKAGRLHSFGANSYNTLITTGAGATLFWADPAGASTNDYDLYVLDSTGTTILAAGTNVQNGHQDPYEIAGTANGARLVIVKAASAHPRFLHLGTLRGRLAESTSGAIVGHAAAEGAVAVAATTVVGVSPGAFGASSVVETFSTDGDRRVFFEEDGTPLTPGDFSATGGFLRPKPDLTGADGVSTTVPGFATFYGTSAAAPHVAAIAALIWSRNRTLAPEQIRAALDDTAIDIEAPGPDRDSGVGIVDALAAAQAVPPGANVTSSGAVLLTESYTPANSRLDAGETVTVSLTLNNVGGANTQDLTATLLNTGGVSRAGTPQAFGQLAPTASATQNFTFVVAGAGGSTVTATFELRDGGIYLGSAVHTFTVGTTGLPSIFTNPTLVSIPTVGTATSYPSDLNVSGMTGSVGSVRVTLTNFSHTYPSDVDMVLVSPSGRKVLLMAGAGGSTAVSNLTVSFDDTAASGIGTVLTTGTFRPTTNGQETTSLPATAPAAPYQTTLGAFSGENPNGVWSLYVRDEFGPDSGSIGSWSLRITPVNTLPSGPNADLATTIRSSAENVAVNETVTFTATVANHGAVAAADVVISDTLPANLVLASATSTLGSVVTGGNGATVTIGTLAPGESATLTLVATATAVGSVTNTVEAALTGTDNFPGNNAASATLLIGQANITPVPAIVSISPGTVTDAPMITPTDSVFLDLAYTNSGTSASRVYFISELYVDGVRRRTFEQQLPLPPGGSERDLDIPLGTFGPGTHTVLYKTDVLGALPESNEADNNLVQTFTVQGPNLTPFKRAGASDRIVVSKVTGTTTDAPAINSNDPVFVDFGLINNGALTTGATTVASLFLDDVLVAQTNVSASLDGGSSTGATDISLGSLPAGVHTLRLVVDAAGTLAETDEADNEAVKTFVVNAVPTVTAIAAQTILEDSATEALGFTVGDGETAAADLVIGRASSNPAVVPTDGISIGGAGADRTVTVTPAAHQSGTSTITLTAGDGSGGSVATTFQVTVLPVNDAPSFVAGPDIAASQDAGPQTLGNWATANDRGGPEESGQTLTFTVGATNPELFASLPVISPAGTLSFRGAPGASGTSTVTVQLRDDGGTANGGVDASATATFQIAITTYAEELGTYNGLALPSAGAFPGAEKCGLLRLTIGKLGKVSGKLVLGGVKWAFRGTVRKDGTVVFGKVGDPFLLLPRGGLSSLTLTLQLDVAGGTDRLSGTIVDGAAAFADITADRALFTSKKSPVAPLVNPPTDLLGNYTLAFLALPAPNGGLTAAQYPQGNGAGILRVSKSGNAKITATLADGTKVSYANALSKMREWPLFVAQKKTPGALAGPVTFRHIAGMSDFDGAVISWFKAAGGAVYPDGWPAGIKTDLVGSRYALPDGETILPGLGAADADGNCILRLDAGGIVGTLSKALSITTAHQVTVIAPGAEDVTLKLAKGTGLFSGSFIHPVSGAKVKLRGAVLREATVGYGFFIDAGVSGSATLEIGP